MELFRQSYYYSDLAIGYGAPLVFLVLYKTRRIDGFIWRFFWIGVLVGLLWEIPIFVLSGESTSLPIVVWNRPFPCHYLVFMVSHSLWDGLLFVIGIGLVRLFCRKPHFEKFRSQELLVLLIWGQVSELLVEISSTANDGWSFVEYWWNPVMFTVNNHNVTWLGQWIWAAAPVLYYVLLIRFGPQNKTP